MTVQNNDASTENGSQQQRELKVYSMEEVAAHNTEESTWIVLHNKVYDVSAFLYEHPGGEEVILQLAGQDATDGFEDVGHSADAREMAEEYLIGRLAEDDARPEAEVEPPQANTPKGAGEALEQVAPSQPSKGESWREILLSPTWSNLLIPVALSIVVYGSYRAAKWLFIMG